MWAQLTQWFQENIRVPDDMVQNYLRYLAIGAAAIGFVVLTTIIIAFDSIFLGVNNIATLEEGELAPRDIVAPPGETIFVSEILTEQARAEARAEVPTIFTRPDPVVAQQQIEQLREILEYMNDVRADVYGSREQRIADLNAISNYSLGESTAETILQLNDETWNAIEDELSAVLARTMRLDIFSGQVESARLRLSNQFNVERFNNREREMMVDIVDDLVVANRFPDVAATEAEREAAAAAVEERTRRFIGGQIIVREGDEIDAEAYEALVALNLLRPDSARFEELVRASVASILTLVLLGMFLARIEPHLLAHQPVEMTLIMILFLLTLVSMRLFGLAGDIYLYPYAAISLLLVAISGRNIAVACTLALAFLAAIMNNNSLEIAVLMCAGGLMGIMMLGRAERLNQFFGAGLVIILINLVVLVIFNITNTSATVTDTAITSQIGQAILNGVILVPATAIAVMYLVTLAFNLPTTLKLIDLSQPNKPLLQRLLREAPGSYQHSLQVANLAEQAASAIGADAELTHVAALYHDIGKMLNPLFFAENQQDISNPHDAINDPYRSASMIIGHVTEGDALARQHGLPSRIRDFIREHHGTTEVYFFYQRAIKQADGNAEAVDASDFRYPGPRPRSKETAILMMADSCEAAVRSIKPESKAEIREIVTNIINSKRDAAQLDESGLTLNDLHNIREIFVDILQSMFHPRINYKEAMGQTPENKKPAAPATATTSDPKPKTKPPAVPDADDLPSPTAPSPVTLSQETRTTTTTAILDDEEIADEEPLSEVPRLPDLDKRRTTDTHRAAPDETPPERANGSTDTRASEEVDKP